MSERQGSPWFWAILIPVFIFFASKSASDRKQERFDAGYDDGYAAGYNTACEIRITLIEGDWDNEHYTNGYHEGRLDGEIQCLREREKKR